MPYQSASEVVIHEDATYVKYTYLYLLPLLGQRKHKYIYNNHENNPKSTTKTLHKIQ